MQLEVGSIVNAKITGITNFGAFAELPRGKRGMVHISEISSDYVENISDYVSIGQKVKVKILSIGEDGKISLSIKKASEKKREKNSQVESPHNEPVKGPGNFEWQARRNDGNFEDMLSHFKQTSDEKISTLKRGEPVNRRRRQPK